MAVKIPIFCNNLYLFLKILDTVMGAYSRPTTICWFRLHPAAESSMTSFHDAVAPAPEVVSAAHQDAFVRAELIRRLFEGSRQSRYFSFVLWPVIAAIYWRQIDLMVLVPPILAHVAVTVGSDVLRRNFAHANPPDAEAVRWGWWFT